MPSSCSCSCSCSCSFWAAEIKMHSVVALVTIMIRSTASNVGWETVKRRLQNYFNNYEHNPQCSLQIMTFWRQGRNPNHYNPHVHSKINQWHHMSGCCQRHLVECVSIYVWKRQKVTKTVMWHKHVAEKLKPIIYFQGLNIQKNVNLYRKNLTEKIHTAYCLYQCKVHLLVYVYVYCK